MTNFGLFFFSYDSAGASFFWVKLIYRNLLDLVHSKFAILSFLKSDGRLP
uniref:Uncharacterized protein n=1 Tax=Rhizophora mucronata TaxID=61149 RepID=A0A2P2QQM4_RHIMU